MQILYDGTSKVVEKHVSIKSIKMQLWLYDPNLFPGVLAQARRKGIHHDYAAIA